MKDLYSGWLMKLMEKWGVKPYKRFDMVSYMGFGCFFLALLPAIIGNELEGGAGKVLLMLLMILLLAVSGYLMYQANSLWMILVLFGLGDVVMAFAIDWSNAQSVWIFSIAGAALLIAGFVLMPRQIRNTHALNDECKRLREKENAAKVRAEMQKNAPPAQETPAEEKPAPSPLEQLKEKLSLYIMITKRPDHQQRPEDVKKKAQEQIADLEMQLGKMLLSQEKLWVLTARVPGAKPVYMGTDGRMEVFTGRELAHKACEMLEEKLHVQTDVLELDGEKGIHTFFGECAYNGIGVMRLDNGTRTMCELWLKNFVSYQAEDLLEGKNCSLRHMLYRAKLYAYLRTKQPEGSDYMHALTEMGLTMTLNAYRELYQGVVYALGDKQDDERVYATEKALEVMKSWGGDIGDPIEKTTTQHLFYVNRPGETGQMDKGSVCVFTDLKHARAAQEMFAKASMPASVMAISCEELLFHASQCAGIVIDMRSLNYEILKEEFDKIRTTGALDAPVLVNLKKKEEEKKPEETPAEKPALPILRDKKKANGWTQYDYQWPGRYGFDYMVKIAQWLIWDGLEPKTLTTGSLGGKEAEHIEAWQEKRYVEKSVGPEAGYLGIGGFHRYVPAPVKVYFYNQTNVVRFFVAGDGHDKGVNDLAERIAQAKLK